MSRELAGQLIVESPGVLDRELAEVEPLGDDRMDVDSHGVELAGGFDECWLRCGRDVSVLPGS